ncbi:CAMK family protein kinase [Tritrichomonas foetus]|uniref:non-specific serine/threonine protein kinase n=1 Tax=Tritrichomonas foetus TaxID=1144522 RepID=A0A1J4KYP5_9EUKA|nr:CAMK family protein kinase [Tritrichomonas foetus]|eukprot:OHT14693.1 CAMK family protein kinase [Tritrichomonas foetus]
MNVSSKEDFSNYLNLQMVGKGTFSNVYLATHKITNIPVAIKAVKKSTLENSQVNRNFQRELRIMHFVDFPFVTHYFNTLEDENYFYIIMEYSKYGSLLDFLNKRGPFSEEAAQVIFCQFLAALNYLHNESHVLHRDLKMENILISSGSSIRLIDFGLSSTFTEEDNLMETRCGSFPYAAPEIFQKKPYTATVDMWSAGIILYTMVVGHLPFQDQNHKKLIQLICNEEPEYPEQLSSELIDLLRGLLNKDRHQRLTVKEASNHPWIRRSNYAFFASDFFITQRQYRVIPKMTSEIDKDIVTKMRNYGYNLNNFEKDIIEMKETAATTVYRMLKQEKITEMIRQQMTTNKDKEITRADSQPSQKLPPLMGNDKCADSIIAPNMSRDSTAIVFKRNSMNKGQLEVILRKSRQPQSNRARPSSLNIVKKLNF